MAVKPEGTPIWIDASFPDLEAAKTFYGEVLGWTFGESSAEYGNYTQAFSDGKAVAGLAPKMPGQDWPTAWCLYFASADLQATSNKIRDLGGRIVIDPMAVGDFGHMTVATDPAGVTFALWQPGTHQGFEKQGEPGSYCWAEITTREAEQADAFFPALFSYATKKMQDEAIDFKLYQLGEDTTLGRMKMTEDFPAGLPSHINPYFAVDDCDEAIAKITKLGGQVHFGPHDSPFGRFAAVSDQQGAGFSVIDMGTTKGDLPNIS
ncbi:VOC family protein [Streptomyces purpurogeneiscleroticus]|uniref:VOC family protein n=1 Tax=Streptomyces purpurogeneiscleroticus TaxID=68259 RepID=UPI001CBBBD33|nr:VOC family protein [Streptomyces purpurogeneiscleroticus]MBZ4014391.1 hydrolase [Streptomyces purpurogeneiscleroticus]